MEGYDKSAKKIIIPEGTEFIPDYAFRRNNYSRLNYSSRKMCL